LIQTKQGDKKAIEAAKVLAWLLAELNQDYAKMNKDSISEVNNQLCFI
jgi:hypothetical protein